ncbi:outer membrane lipoprotein carrier protein LolA [Flavobacterium columnare]|nr:outer membrane lipoprotein carrier protein LolA [Flavobacterium columnare]MBF6651347.1 cell envelope biogenesis protein LolA [Flavobacterium columnare]MBF6654999.1 cell envelope biogenesis protein LolA [Flavobacterium columnare]MBF6658225.1 cell envelope biogenesis protein LolA [Flavobacterium columnare]MEB3802010.1 outer membrane lipoprotein carrier protein LolA [Flavobacterium columnare]
MTDSEIVSFKNLIEKENKNIKTIKTDFIQYKHLDFLSKDIESTGKMYFRLPNLLNWQYNKPYQYSIVFKNNKVFINDQGKKSTVDGKLFEKINKMIIGSVSGNMFDDKEFAISYFKTKEGYLVKLISKSNQVKKYIKQIELIFPKEDPSVSQVKLIEPSDDFTKIVFKNRQVNAKFNDEVFDN